MSEQEQLPACRICETLPRESHSGMTCECDAEGCPMRGWIMAVDDWRRTMARPRLAPEHVERLRGLMSCGYVSQQETAAIRAALAALGEEVEK